MKHHTSRHSRVVTDLAGLLAVGLLIAGGCGTQGLPTEGDGTQGGALAGLAPADRRPNVLLVILDCVRVDRVGYLGYEQGTTPNLDALASAGLAFERAYAPATWTLPSHVGIFTGHYTDLHGAPEDAGIGIPAWTPTMAGVLGANGYRTGFFATAPMMLEWQSMARSFDRSLAEEYMNEFPQALPLPGQPSERRVKAPGPPEPYTEDGKNVFKPEHSSTGMLQINEYKTAYIEYTAPRFIDWLGQAPDEPFFAFVHSNDAHYPYLCGDRVPEGDAPAAEEEIENKINDFFVGRPEDKLAQSKGSPQSASTDELLQVAAGAQAPDPDRLRKRGSPENLLNQAELEILGKHYDQCVQQADAGLGEIVEALRDHGVLDDTVLIVAADHGESLGEDGQYGHGTMFRNTGMGEELIRVPLVVHYPAGGIAGRRTEPVSLVDVFPTALEAAGVESPPHDGRSLWTAPDPTAAAERRILCRGARARVVPSPGETGRMDHLAVVRDQMKVTVDHDMIQFYFLGAGMEESEAETFDLWHDYLDMMGEFYLHAPSAPAPASTWRREPPTRRFNLLVIDLPALRRDRVLGAKAHLDRTPALARLLRESVVFERAAASSYWTGPALATLMTGRHPFSHGVIDRRAALADEEWTMAEVLAAHGYRSAAFTGGLDTRASFGLDQGFELYDDGDEDQLRTLREVLPALRRWLDDSDDEPHFALVSGYDLHAPWHPTQQPGTGAMSNEPAFDCAALDAQWLTDWRAADGATVTLPDGQTMSQAEFVEGIGLCYDACLIDVDRALGEMYDDLRRRNTLDSTLVVLTSDHGDSLGERGHATRYHAEEFRSEVSRVPLLMRLPRQDGAGRRIDGWIGAVDVMPTILDLLDVTPPAGTEGRSWAAAVKALEQPPQVGPAGAVFTIDRNKLAFLSDDRLLVVGLRGPPQLFIIAQDDPAAEDQPLDDPQQLFDYLEAFARYAEEHHLEVSPQEGSGSLPNPALVELLQKYGYWQ